jgi:predicted CoA-substrate-specific enzyme activase
MFGGLDVGSRTIKLVTLGAGVVESRVVETGVNPLLRCQELTSGKDYERLVVTGYGRHLVAPVLNGEVVSEIKAFAAGSRYLLPDCGTVIDIGGQDSKVILLSDNGEVRKFEMNDRCAAGTGKFLEVMAHTLGVDIGGMGDLALSATRRIQINSLCTVFAESEVISLIARGEEVNVIALALHEAIVTRIAAMVRRNGLSERVAFAGGGAFNKCLITLLKRDLDCDLSVPGSPQTVGALGAAILAEDGFAGRPNSR